MVNQICIAGLVEALAEGLNFAIKAGLDAKLVLDVISKVLRSPGKMENRGKTMVEDKFDFGFAVDWMRKDLRICSENGTGDRRSASRYPDGRRLLRRGIEDGRRPLGYLQSDPAAAPSLIRAGGSFARAPP